MDSQQVAKIAHLARLAVDADQLMSLSKDLTNILDLVDELDKANTQDTAPMAHPLDMKQRLRSDNVSEENQRENFQSVAPATEDGLYLVPKVIE